MRPTLAPLGLLLLASLAIAQIDRSSLTGTVHDQTNAGIPEVTIHLTRPTDGLTRDTKSTPTGSYQIPDLPPGDYRVTFSKPNFAPTEFESVTLTVGLTRTLDASLGVASSTQGVTVSEPAAQLDKTTSSLGGRIEKKQLEELPLNGRNWYSLTALVPGAIDSGGSNMKSIRFAGHGLDDNNFTLDGIDATGIVNQAQRGQGRMTIPIDSIAEFRVESALYSTELGGAPGGQVSVTSASGTNALHGTAYEYLRNNVLNARSPFDPSSAPPFQLNQFGASLGGPILPNRAFFYTNYEGYRQNLGQTITGFVPSDSFRATVSPSLAPLLAAYPHSNGPLADANTAAYIFQGKQRVNEDTGMVRLDYRFSDTLTSFLRYNQDEAVSNVPTGTIGLTQTVDTQPKNGVAELLRVFSPALTNETKFGFNQEITHTRTLSPLAYTIAAPGFSSITNGNTKDERGASLSFIDNVSWVFGRHVLKAGAEIRYVEMNQGNSFTGTLTYSTLANFAANRLDKATQTATLPTKHQRKTQVFSFLQDEYKIRPNLTLNIGLRYELYNVFHELDNRALPFDFNTCGPGGYCPRGSPFTFPNKLDFDPRAALAWSLGNTVIRIGGGIYHGDGQLDDQNLPIANDVQRYSLTRATFPDLTYPVDPFLNQATGVITPRLLDRHRKDEYSTQWGASVQQRLTNDIVGTVSYIGEKGTHLLTTSYVNALIPGTLTRPYPAFGIVEYRGNNSNSNFEGLQLSVQRSYRKNLLFSANYLWSHSLNDGATGGGEANFPQNLNCRACDRASSDQDIRHVFNANTVYTWHKWQLSGIATARTGLPVNVTVDRASGDLPDGYNTNQRPDVTATGFAIPPPGRQGNAGRNLLRGPNLWQLDASLDRKFPITERLNLEFRAEGFNLANHPQFGLPQADISSPTYGRTTTLVNNGSTGTGTPRQFQFALRLNF